MTDQNTQIIANLDTLISSSAQAPSKSRNVTILAAICLNSDISRKESIETSVALLGGAEAVASAVIDLEMQISTLKTMKLLKSSPANLSPQWAEEQTSKYADLTKLFDHLGKDITKYDSQGILEQITFNSKHKIMDGLIFGW